MWYNSLMNFEIDPYLLSQILGAIGAVIAICGPQFKHRWQMLVAYALCNLFWAAHFWILGAIVAALMSVTGSLRFVVAIFSKARWILWLFVVLNVLVAWYTWEIWYVSVLALISSLFIIFSSFVATDRLMRILVICGTLGWLIYDILIWTYVGMLANTFFFISGVIGFLRFEQTYAE